MRLQNLDLNLLVILDRLATDGNVSQVAQTLGLSQSAVSNALRRLRAHFEDELFTAIGGRMVPTALAESLSGRVRRAIIELEEVALSRARFDPATAQRTFTIVSSDYSFLVLVTGVIRRLREIAPGICIRSILTTEQTPELLRQGQADFVIVPRERTVDDYPAERLFEDSFACVVWRDNRKVGDTLTQAEFVSLSHVSTSLGAAPIPHLQDEALARHGIVRRIAVYAPNFTSVAEAVVGTDLIAMMHARSARLFAERLPVRIVTPPMALRPFTEMLQWHKRKEGDPGIIWMRQILKDVAATLPPLESASHPE